jgi:phosphatidylserine/phosphatidylglycerophosphate/cardiolipin synthase-like enzyme
MKWAVFTTIWAMAAGLCVAAAAEEPLFADSPFAATVQAAVGNQGPLADPTVGNSVAIIDSGYDALLLRVHLIRNARRSIDIQTFIWTNDECGRLLMYELIEAARRGVKVRIIADHLASDKDSDTVAFLATADPNLTIKHYRPAASRIKPSVFRTVISCLRSVRGANQRMHNKIMVFDDAVLITGGRNIENSYYGHSTEMNFKDRDVLAIGPAAAVAGRSFDEYWECRYALLSRDLVDVAAAIERGGFRRYNTREDWDFGPFFQDLCRQADAIEEIRSRILARLHPVRRAEFLADKPGKNNGFLFSGQGRITRRLTDIIWEAKEAVIMQSPYLVLSGKARELFARMRANRPSLRIIVSSNSFGSTDNILAYSANYRLRASYIEGLRMEIHEYKPLPADLLAVLPAYPQLKRMAEQRQAEGKQSRLPFLCIHAKSLVIDDRIAFIGSFNLDPRSENLNTEAGLLIDDAQIATELKQEILRDAGAGNSWTIAKRALPLQLDKVNRVVDEVLGLLPIDMWPLQNTTSYELVPGKTEAPPSHPDFLRNYRAAGDFPGAPPGLSTKEIMTRLYKAVGPLVTPMI